jgi:hypothetical protein
MKWKEGQQFELPPGGSHLARCYALVDQGTQKHSWQGDIWEQRDVRLAFELAHEKMTGKYNEDAKGKPYMVATTVKQSLHKKARLRKLLEGWRGRAFGDGEADKFDPRKLPGLLCRLTLVASATGDYMNIESVAPATKKEAEELKNHKWHNKVVFLSLEVDEFKPDVYKELPEKAREAIAKSPEYKALFSSGGEEPQADAQDQPDDPGDDAPGDVPF